MTRADACSHPFCTLHWMHAGECNVVRPACATDGCMVAEPGHEVCLTPLATATRVSLNGGPRAAREVTPYGGAEPGDRPRFGQIVRALIFSPIGAMWGLALIALLWASGVI